MLREIDLTSTYTGAPYFGGNFGIFMNNEASTTSSSVNLTFARGGIVTELKPTTNLRLDSYQGYILNESALWANLTFARGEVVADLKSPVNLRPDSYESFLLNEPAFETTSSGFTGFFLVLIVLGALMVAITNYRITYAQPKLPSSIKLPDTVFLPISTPMKPKTVTSAERLRTISGLDIELLAAMFQVSRTTYHKWIKGSTTPRRKHREHLLEVLSHVEKAAQRIGSQSATANWLLTPISATGKKPFEYLAMREYQIFRGFLLQVQTGQETIRHLTSSNRVYREFSDEEVKDALARLRPKARIEEDDKEE
jgi:transcriptional regulator with XRE-family HTH domain